MNISKTGRVIVRVSRLMEDFVRRADGSRSDLLADVRFDNHNKMNIMGVVQVGSDVADVNPVEDGDREFPRSHHYRLPSVPGSVFEVDIRAGDVVYFHYLCVENKVSMDRNGDGSWDVYMQVSDIFCLERDGIMRMNRDWVLAHEPPADSGILTPMGYRVSRDGPATGIEVVKGFSIPSHVDEAIVDQIDPTLYHSISGEVKASDRVYLSKDAAFPNIIRNKRHLLIRQSDILGIQGKSAADTAPVGTNHLVWVEPKEYKSTVIHHTVVVKAPEYGIIIRSGALCKKGVPGDKIVFTRRFTRVLDMSTWIVEDGEILATLD